MSCGAEAERRKAARRRSSSAAPAQAALSGVTGGWPLGARERGPTLSLTDIRARLAQALACALLGGLMLKRSGPGRPYPRR